MKNIKIFFIYSIMALIMGIAWQELDSLLSKRKAEKMFYEIETERHSYIKSYLQDPDSISYTNFHNQLSCLCINPIPHYEDLIYSIILSNKCDNNYGKQETWHILTHKTKFYSPNTKLYNYANSYHTNSGFKAQIK